MAMTVEKIEGSVELVSVHFSGKSATIVLTCEHFGKEMTVTYTTRDTALFKYFRDLQIEKMWKVTLELPEDENWNLKQEPEKVE